MQIFTALFILLTSCILNGAENLQNIDVRDIRDTFTSELYNQKSLTDSNKELFFNINRMVPFQSVRHISTYHDQLLNDLSYTIGEFGHRSIDTTEFNKARKHLIIAGDSNTFGIGLRDKETLPYLLAKTRPDYFPYNFGIRGGAPNSTLALMEFFPWETGIRQPQGYFIYVYFDFLIDRVVGAKNTIKWNSGNSPAYEINDKGGVEFKGYFRDFLITDLYKKISDITWLDNLLVNLPRHSKSHSELVAKIFLKMKQLYLQKFPQGKFVVALNYGIHETIYGRLEELRVELARNKIESIVFPFQAFGPDYKQPDGHISADGQKTEAEIIMKSLEF